MTKSQQRSSYDTVETTIIIWQSGNKSYKIKYFGFQASVVNPQSNQHLDTAMAIKVAITTTTTIILNWRMMCKNRKSGHLVVALSALVSCVVIQTAFGRRYSELMDGRITIRRIERDTLTHLNLAPSLPQVNTSYIYFTYIKLTSSSSAVILSPNQSKINWTILSSFGSPS